MTIHNKNLIEQVGGIEQLKESLLRFLNLQLDESNPNDVKLLDYVIENKCNPLEVLEQLNRTAIAEHDKPQLCIDCGSSDLHKGGEIKEPKMCFKCYAAMVGFTLFGDQLIEDDELAEIKAGHRIDKRLESDDCTDIRNHLSPSTRVVDL